MKIATIFTMTVTVITVCAIILGLAIAEDYIMANTNTSSSTSPSGCMHDGDCGNGMTCSSSGSYEGSCNW